VLSIVPIVEGPGDVSALPILLRRLLQERYQRYDGEIARPKKAGGSGNLIKEGGLERYLAYAATTPGCGSILVLIDADHKCPKELAECLASRSEALGLDKPIAVVCAKCEYETWFLASLDTIRGRVAISSTASFTGEVESLRGAKEWLSDQMPPDRNYKETVDQPSLTPFIDLGLAHENSRSFRRLCHAVEQLLAAMDSAKPIVTPFTA
jgi:hypothetical protein